MHDINNENAIRRFSDDGFPTKHTPLEVSESHDVRITLLHSSAHVSWSQSWSPFLFSSFRLLDHDMNRYKLPVEASFISHIQGLPTQTTPTGYVRPSCSTPVDMASFKY